MRHDCLALLLAITSAGSANAVGPNNSLNDTGIVLFGMGLLGEYVGRIYEQVRGRPRYIVEAVLEQKSSAAQNAGTRVA